jgi:uncharacterized protein (DUF885 family)
VREPSRREILLSSVALGAAAALPGLPAFAAISDADKRLFDAFEAIFEARLERHPLTALRLGIKRDLDKLDDASEEAQAEDLAIAKANLARLRKEFPEHAISPDSRFYLKLFAADVARAEILYRWRTHLYPLTTTGGAHIDLPIQLINQHKIDSKSDAVGYITRLRLFPLYFGQIVERLNHGRDAGVLPPKFFFPVIIQTARNQITGRPFDESDKDSPLFADLKSKIGALDAPQPERDALLADAANALKSSVRPAYDGLIAWLERAEPNAPTSDGVWHLPGGDKFYADALKYATTTDYSAEQIHQIGLKEVARIQHEMEAIKAEVGFAGSLQDFFKYLREDARFYYPDTDDGRAGYLRDATAIIDTMRAHLDDWFGLQPKAPLEVRAVEKFREGSSSSAFYERPSADGRRAGIFYVNLGNLKARPKFGLESLAYHEGIPGHHLQIAIQQELVGVPSFQRLLSFNSAFGEGWALYTEQLGKEMGFYQDPYSDFGRLVAELWRSIRLVVDTGIHAKKWTREEAVAYFVANSSLDEAGARREIDRYIGWPGQATSYKIGMIRILELREQAKKRLGSRFDIKGFHDTVLRHSSVPLDILGNEVQAWKGKA